MSRSKTELAYYPRYIDRWRQSGARMQMNFAERGLYWELLDYIHEHGQIPCDLRSIMSIASGRDRDFLKAWPKVSQWFRQEGDFYVHDAATQIRASIVKTIEKKSLGGKHSAYKTNIKRWKTVETPDKTPDKSLDKTPDKILDNISTKNVETLDKTLVETVVESLSPISHKPNKAKREGGFLAQSRGAGAELGPPPAFPPGLLKTIPNGTQGNGRYRPQAYDDGLNDEQRLVQAIRSRRGA